MSGKDKSLADIPALYCRERQRILHRARERVRPGSPAEKQSYIYQRKQKMTKICPDLCCAGRNLRVAVW